MANEYSKRRGSQVIAKRDEIYKGIRRKMTMT